MIQSKHAFIIILIALCAFTKDYDPTLSIHVGDKQIGFLTHNHELLYTNNYSLEDTLFITAYMCAGLPDDGVLILKDSAGNNIRILDKDNPYNLQRPNGKKYNVPIKDLKNAGIFDFGLYHSCLMWDTLGYKPHYYGRLVLQ